MVYLRQFLVELIYTAVFQKRGVKAETQKFEFLSCCRSVGFFVGFFFEFVFWCGWFVCFCFVGVFFFISPHIFLLQNVPTLLMNFGLIISVESGR